MQVRDLIPTAVFCCAAALSVAAVPVREVSGVRMPDAVRGDDNKELRLNGVGLRKEKAFFKVYVIKQILHRGRMRAQLATEWTVIMANDAVLIRDCFRVDDGWSGAGVGLSPATL